MARRKTLKELTLKDNFMFGAVMCHEENCRRLLEMILQFPIERVEVSKEKSIVFHPEYKGVRLDVYAKDEHNTHYNVEMQSVQKSTLSKRTRYYHSQIDMELLLCGADYSELPDTYVIFICDFDPFGEGKYRYTFEQRCKEVSELKLMDGSRSIFLNTCGENEKEVSKELVTFLKYLKADLQESIGEFEDDFVKSLQQSVQKTKESRGREERLMGWYDLVQEELAEARAEGRALGIAEGKTEGKAEAVLELLQQVGNVSADLRSRIMSEKNETILKKWLRLAAGAESTEQFRKEM